MTSGRAAGSFRCTCESLLDVPPLASIAAAGDEASRGCYGPAIPQADLYWLPHCLQASGGTYRCFPGKVAGSLSPLQACLAPLHLAHRVCHKRSRLRHTGGVPPPDEVPPRPRHARLWLSNLLDLHRAHRRTGRFQYRLYGFCLGRCKPMSPMMPGGLDRAGSPDDLHQH